MYIGNPWRKLDHSSIYNKKLPWRELRNQMVDRQGFEPWTLGLRVPCSSQLS